MKNKCDSLYALAKCTEAAKDGDFDTVEQLVCVTFYVIQLSLDN